MDIEAASPYALAVQASLNFELVLNGNGYQVEVRLRQLNADAFTFDLFLRRFGMNGYDEVRVGGHPLFEERQSAIDAGVEIAARLYREGW